MVACHAALVLLLPPVKRSPHLFDKAISGYFGPILVQPLNRQLFDNQSFVVVDFFLPSLSCCA